MRLTTLVSSADLRNDLLYEEYANEEDRLANLVQYATMDDESPEFSDALDSLSDLIIQGDDVQMNGYKTVSDPNNKTNAKAKAKENATYNIGYMLDAKTPTAEATRIEEIIKTFEDRTELKYKLKYYVRNALKYGDYFGNIIYGETVVTKQRVIAEILDIASDKITINLDIYGRLDLEKPYQLLTTSQGNELITYQKHEIFRIQMGGVADYEYGRSIAHSARKVYNQLSAIETGMVIGRLVRSHQRYLYKIDTGNWAPDVSLDYVKKVKIMMTKKKMTDKNGNLIYAKSPLTAEEDIFLPVKSKSADDVVVMKADEFLKNIDDVKYFADKYFRALKIISLGSSDSKGSRNAVAELQNSTTAYAKGVQQLIRYPLEKLYNMELKLHGINQKITIVMPEIASVLTLRKFDVERLKAEISKIYHESGVLSDEYIREYILYLNDEELATEFVRANAKKAETLSLLQLTKNPQGGGSARVTTQYKTKKIGKKVNNYVTPRNATETKENIE